MSINYVPWCHQQLFLGALDEIDFLQRADIGMDILVISLQVLG